MYFFNLSFPVAHKVNNVGIFVLFKFENSIKHFNFISKPYDRCKFALKLFHLHCTKMPTLSTFVYYILLWENSTDRQGIDAIAHYEQFLYVISQPQICVLCFTG